MKKYTIILIVLLFLQIIGCTKDPTIKNGAYLNSTGTESIIIENDKIKVSYTKNTPIISEKSLEKEDGAISGIFENLRVEKIDGKNYLVADNMNHKIILNNDGTLYNEKEDETLEWIEDSEDIKIDEKK